MDSVEDNGGILNPNPSSVITNGAVSGVLPQAEAFAVNYPGYPSSPSRAIDSLGGLQEIAKTRSSDSGQLELRFRPEDPHGHPAFGERRAFSGLLLRLSKTRHESDDGGKLSAEIVARVNETYNFEGMVDYQHVPAVHAAELRRKKRHCVFEDDDLDNGEDVMMLLPQLFSLKNTPEEIVLIPPPNLFSKNLQKSVVEHQWEMDIEQCLAIDFNIERVPKKVNWEDNIPSNTTEWEWQLAVSKLFEERPIWPRRSIHEQLVDNGVQVTDHTLRRFLFRSGYYFATGPFGRFWIKKGYDPRKDPESRIYQRVDFRVPSQLRNGSDTGHRLKQTWNNICRFQVFPGRNFTSLQLFELDDDFIRDEIEKPTNQTTCTRTRGWFSETRLKTLRLRVSMRFLSICPHESAGIILRSITEEFERCKKLAALGRTRKPVLKHQDFNQDTDMSMDVVCMESSDTEDQPLVQSDPNNCDIECDGKEEEEEEEEEELDAYEFPTMAVEDSCFSQETAAFGDDMPNNYLQDILSEFAFCKGGKDSRSDEEGHAHDAELSDGEYQIYEQDSDEDGNDDGNFDFT